MSRKGFSKAHSDELLDAALNDSFPASDPPSCSVFDPAWSCDMENSDAPDLLTNQPVAAALNALLADFFVLFMKTKGCHWHVSGPHFRDYHRLFDEQAMQILSATDVIAERVRKIGAKTVDSITRIVTLARVADTLVCDLRAPEMLATLLHDNREIVTKLASTKSVAERACDSATCSMLDDWIDQAEGRAWFLFEASRH